MSAEAVPYRPHRGVRVIVESLWVMPARLAAHDDWWRDEHVAALCALEGVAGVWRFETSTRFDDHQWRPGPRRIAMVWIDGDLDATSRELAALGRIRAEHAAGATVTDMDATLETITPWQWDWFDRT